MGERIAMATFGPLRMVLTGLLLLHAAEAGARKPGPAAPASAMPMPLTSVAPVRPVAASPAPEPSAPGRSAAAEEPLPTPPAPIPALATTGSRVHPVIYRLGTTGRPGLTADVVEPDGTGRPPARRGASVAR